MKGAEKAGGNRVLFSNKNISWGTPQDLFDALDQEFHFTLDAAASDKNHKCKKYYTEETDGLSHSWRGETVFLNPPYGKTIGLWMKKALLENRGVRRSLQSYRPEPAPDGFMIMSTAKLN